MSEAPGEGQGVLGQQNHAHNFKRLFSEQLRLAYFCLILLKNRKYFIVFRWKKIEKNQFNKYWRNVKSLCVARTGGNRIFRCSRALAVEQFFISVDGYPGPPVVGVFAQPQRGRARAHFGSIPAAFHAVTKSPFPSIDRFDPSNNTR